MSFKAEPLPRARQALAQVALEGHHLGARSAAVAAMAAGEPGAECQDPPAAGAAPAAVAVTVAAAAADTSHIESVPGKISRCGRKSNGLSSKDLADARWG